jgi:hypothetical protein
MRYWRRRADAVLFTGGPYPARFLNTSAFTVNKDTPRRQPKFKFSYLFRFLKMVPAERVFAFSIGKNSKIRARRTEPRIDVKQELEQ